MAIADIYNSLTFGGVNSLDYGIYISGPGVFDAPARAVRFVDVPGRNGAIEIDEGHWNNIEVTYKAGTFGDNQPDFASKINAFRNAIVSQVGYQRLRDTYNPDEYRLGIYASGLSVDAVNRNEAGEFDLVFNCKPQRYLLSGENEITVTTGDVITNPTLYKSGPLIETEGSGDININDSSITINADPFGDVSIFGFLFNQPNPKEFEFDQRIMNPGDEISVAYFRGNFLSEEVLSFVSEEIVGSGFTHEYTLAFYSEIILRNMTFEFGTPKTISYTLNVTGSRQNGKIFLEVVYDGQGRLSFRSGYEGAGISQSSPLDMWYGILHSTKIATEGTIYIDCELGDVYKIENGEYIDLNKYVALGSDLPKLSPGANEITFDNTISSLKIIPRWWEL